jgi:hypothetical protein
MDGRLGLLPNDRILFVQNDRIREGLVTRVDIKCARVECDTGKDASGECVKLDLRNHGSEKEWSLVAMFRPQNPLLCLPPGMYMNFPHTDLWLDLGDVVELIVNNSPSVCKDGIHSPTQTVTVQVTAIEPRYAKLRLYSPPNVVPKEWTDGEWVIRNTLRCVRMVRQQHMTAEANRQLLGCLVPSS